MGKKKDWKQQAAVGVIVAAAGTSILVGSSFDSPADILDDGNAVTIAAQTDDGSTVTSSDDEDRQRKGSPVRRWILRLPLAVRACLCIPLWCIGSGILWLLSLLYQAALTPIGSTILSWILTAAVVFCAFCLTAKAIFPDVPLKKLLRPRYFLLTLGGVFLLGIADLLLSCFWEDYPNIGSWLRLLGSGLILGISAISLWRLAKRRRSHAAKKDHPTNIEQHAMELADTVCPQPIYHVE